MELSMGQKVYELAYKEQERSQALLEEMKKMAEERSSEYRMVGTEFTSVQDHLPWEKNTITQLEQIQDSKTCF